MIQCYRVCHRYQTNAGVQAAAWIGDFFDDKGWQHCGAVAIFFTL